jgi:hypothetical protein
MMQRNDLEDQILRTVPMPRLVTAALFLMRQRRCGDIAYETAEAFADGLAEFVESLDVEQLEELRQLALGFRDMRESIH